MSFQRDLQLLRTSESNILPVHVSLMPLNITFERYYNTSTKFQLCINNIVVLLTFAYLQLDQQLNARQTIYFQGRHNVYSVLLVNHEKLDIKDKIY